MQTNDLHLSKYVAWTGLLDNLYENKSSVKFTTGNCGKIHIEKKSDLIKIRHRHYITDNDICKHYLENKANCPSTTKKYFHKKKGFKFNINLVRGRICRNKKRLIYFVESLIKTIGNFATSRQNNEILVSSSNFDISFLANYQYTDIGKCFDEYNDLSKWPTKEKYQQYSKPYGNEAIILADILKRLIWQNRMDQVFALINNGKYLQPLLIANNSQKVYSLRLIRFCCVTSI